MSGDKREIRKEELEQVQGGHEAGPQHDHEGRDPVPQQRRKPFGQVKMTGVEGGEQGQRPGDPASDSPLSDG